MIFIKVYFGADIPKMFLDGGANPNSAASVTGIFNEKRLKIYRLTDIERKT